MKTLKGERVGRSDGGLDQVGVEREGGGEGVVGVEGGRDGGQGLGVTRCGSNYKSLKCAITSMQNCRCVKSQICTITNVCN